MDHGFSQIFAVPDRIILQKRVEEQNTFENI